MVANAANISMRTVTCWSNVDLVEDGVWTCLGVTVLMVLLWIETLDFGRTVWEGVNEGRMGRSRLEDEKA